jgi:hypothetical protein
MMDVIICTVLCSNNKNIFFDVCYFIYLSNRIHLITLIFQNFLHKQTKNKNYAVK